jgi:ABC-type transport system involved in multi-copper enzyme maturation permease subunit
VSLSGWKIRIGLPLLAKELLEQSARKRTYVVRTLYAGLSFTIAWLLYCDLLRVGLATPQAALGSGRQMFGVLMKLQFAGIYLVTPAVACGLLAHEKEQNSLSLLFLTKLGPWTILFEKLFSRLVPVCLFVLTSLPLLAYAYSLGGITRAHLWTGVWMLLITALQIASLSLLCSTWFRTTVGAFVGAYAGVAILIFGPMLLLVLLSPFFDWAQYSAWERSAYIQDLWFQRQIIRNPEEILMPLFTPVHFFDYGVDVSQPGFKFSYHVGPARSMPSLVFGSVPILASTGVFLVLSRVFLVRRAFIVPRRRLLNAFRKLDGLFARLNEGRLTKGIVLIRDKATFPDSDPVAWRETTKRSLGRARYLIRIGVAVEALLIALLIFMVIFTEGSPGGAAKVLTFLGWGLAVLVVAVQSASLIAGERSQQTLDVLCATPLSGREIVIQKFAGVRRLIALLWLPMLTVIWPDTAGWASLACSLTTLAIYLPLVAWVSLFIGLKIRSRVRAIVAALTTIAGWWLGLLILAFMPVIFLLPFDRTPTPLSIYVLLSPAAVVYVNQARDWRAFGGDPWPSIILNFIIHLIALFYVRRQCLVHADRLLGRAQSPEDAKQPRRQETAPAAAIESA